MIPLPASVSCLFWLLSPPRTAGASVRTLYTLRPSAGNLWLPFFPLAVQEFDLIPPRHGDWQLSSTSGIYTTASARCSPSRLRYAWALELHSPWERNCTMEKTTLLICINNYERIVYSLSRWQAHQLKVVRGALLGHFAQYHVSGSRPRWILGER